MRHGTDPGTGAPMSKLLQLYTNSKRLAWDPATIDLARDREDWARIVRDHPVERYDAQVHRLCALFHDGEASVTSTLAPFCMAATRLGLGMDVEMYLASQLYEEARHYEFFRRYFAEVFGEDGAVAAAAEMAPAPQAVLVADLAEVADRLRREDDPWRLRLTMVEAVTHYMGVVEAMLARTGYVGAHEALAARGWLPGLQEGFRLIRRDEGRHVSFGIHFIAWQVREHPALAEVVRATFERHLPNVMATVQHFDVPHPIVDLGRLQQHAIDAYVMFMGAAGLGEAGAGEALVAELAAE